MIAVDGKGNKLQTNQIGVSCFGNFQLLHAQTEYGVDNKQTQQSETCNGKTHNRAALESDLDGLADIRGLPCGVGNTDVGIGGDFHADIAGTAGHNRTDDQSHRRAGQQESRT